VRILELEDKLVEAREEMRYKATHDSLTGLWNRGSIVSDFDRELARARREDGVVTLLICDLDHFKQVNDVYGHLAGDEVLQSVASRLVNSVRSYDMVGRYGGEEFLLVLAGCDANLAERRAEEIRSVVAGRAIETSSGLLSVTLSIGVLTSDLWGNELGASQLLKEADKALYCAKADGRNCARIALPSLRELLTEVGRSHG